MIPSAHVLCCPPTLPNNSTHFDLQRFWTSNWPPRTVYTALSGPKGQLTHGLFRGRLDYVNRNMPGATCTATYPAITGYCRYRISFRLCPPFLHTVYDSSRDLQGVSSRASHRHGHPSRASTSSTSPHKLSGIEAAPTTASPTSYSTLQGLTTPPGLPHYLEPCPLPKSSYFGTCPQSFPSGTLRHSLSTLSTIIAQSNT